MTFNLIFSVLAVSVVVLARPDGQKGPGGPGGPGGHGGPQGGPPGGRHGGPGGPPPLPFLANVSAAGQKEFEDVFRNENLTLSEIDTQVAALAEKYGVSDIYKEFQANVTAHLAEVKKNQTAVISNLSSVASQLEAIFSNKAQTRQAQHEAVEALRNSSRGEVDAVQFIRAQFERGPGGPGGSGGRGGPQGGPHGGQRGGPQGGPQGGPPSSGFSEDQ
ncbi:unnamed protein product [Caenorhabditis sp. 36 PRJEB53466]|nr:unnamed protein product [Caenorhabditis sp. 36 PRJEB53466]